MSLSNIISDNDAPPPSYSKYQEPPRPSKSHTAHLEPAPPAPELGMPPQSHTAIPPSPQSNHLVNGHGIKHISDINGTTPIFRARPDITEVALECQRIDSMELSDEELPYATEKWRWEFSVSTGKRSAQLTDGESLKRKVRGKPA
jgi:hypothetical protein